MNQFSKQLLATTACACMLLYACKKELSTPDPKNNTPYVRSSFEGIVTDKDNHGIDSAEVTSGGVTIYTDSTGYFRLTQVLVDSTQASVIAGKDGYAADTITMVTHSYASHQVQFILGPAH